MKLYKSTFDRFDYRKDTEYRFEVSVNEIFVVEMRKN